MKKKVLAMALSLAMVFTMLPVTSVKADEGSPSEETYVTAGDACVENLARSATVTAGYTNEPSAVEKIVDGTLADSVPANTWNSCAWRGGDALEAATYPMPVTLTWTEAQTISSMRVMWWADGTAVTSGVVFPSAATIRYKDENENWNNIDKPVGVEHGGINGENGVWNVVNFDNPIKAKSLQMLISRGESTGATGVGISEWEVFSNKFKEKMTEATVSGATELAIGQAATYVGSTLPKTLENSATYAWSVPADSQSLIQIEGAADEKNVSIKALAAGDAKLHLAATEDGVTQETDFTIKTMTEQDILNSDANLLRVPGKAVADFDLTTTSKNGYNVTWASDNDAIAISGGKAAVTVTNEGKKVKLTATVTGKDDVTPKKTAEKKFTVVVPSNINLAADAEVTGSFEGGWSTVLNNIKDGNDETAWNGHSRYDNTPNVDTFTYTFADKLELTGSAIRFKDDGSGVMLPESVKFEYFDDNASDWKTVSPDDGENWVFAAEEGKEYREPGKDKEYGFMNKIITNQIKLTLTNRKNSNEEATQKYIPAFIYEWTLIGAKYVKPDLTSLNSLITQAAALDTSGKDAEKVARFTAALEAARAVAADKNPTQAQVDKAYADLDEAFEALGGVVTVDKTLLNAAVTAAEAKVAEKDTYTPASWEKVENALATAKDLQTSDTAKQPAINAATEALNKAVAELVKKANKDALDTAISSAAALTESDYTSESWSKVSAALETAKALQTNPNATQKQVDDAVTALNAAIEGLVSAGGGPSRASLITAINNAKAKKAEKDKYTAESWQKVEDALTAAENLAENADQAAINKAAKDLNDALNALEEKGNTPVTPDRTELNTVIGKAEALTKTEYTAESWEKVANALKAAKELAEDATQEAINAAAKDLNDAMGALVKVDPNTAPATPESIATLTSSVNDAAKKYQKGNYTDASWNAYEQALKAAQDVLNNKAATKAQVEKAKADLENAIKALKAFSVTKKKVTIGLKESYSVKSTGSTYTTTKSNIVKITNAKTGQVKGMKTGTAVVKATNNATGKITEYTITVKKAPKKISKITLNKKAIKKKKANLKKGKSATLKVTLPKGTASYKITYTSSKRKVATVDAKGKIKAKKKGKTTITVKTFNKKKMTFTLTVN